VDVPYQPANHTDPRICAKVTWKALVQCRSMILANGTAHVSPLQQTVGQWNNILGYYDSAIVKNTQLNPHLSPSDRVTEVHHIIISKQFPDFHTSELSW